MKVLADSINSYSFYKKYECKETKSYKNEIIEQLRRIDQKADAEIMMAQRVYCLTFAGKTDGMIYAIDKDFNCREFASIKEAVKALELNRHQVLNCLRGQINTFEGFVFAGAYEIENSKGGLDIEKVKKIAEDRFRNSIQDSGKDVKPDKHIEANGIYIIDKYGKRTKYPSVQNAIKTLHLQILEDAILSCLEGNTKTAGGFIFVPSEKIETIDEKGEIQVDIEKADAVFRDRIGKSAVYLVNIRNKRCRKYLTAIEAANEIRPDLNAGAVSQCVYGLRKTIGDYFVVRADEIEKVRADGTRIINIEKLNHEINERTAAKRVYAVNPDGTYMKFDSPSDATRYFNLRTSEVLDCIRHYNNKISGHTFVSASEIEHEQQDGTSIIDDKKLCELTAERFKNRPIYSIDENDNYVKYEDLEQEIGRAHV